MSVVACAVLLTWPVSQSYADDKAPPDEWVACPKLDVDAVVLPKLNSKNGNVVCKYYHPTNTNVLLGTKEVGPSVAGKKYASCLRENKNYKANRSPFADRMWCSYVTSQADLVKSAYEWGKGKDTKSRIDFGYRVVTILGTVIPTGLIVGTLIEGPVSLTAAAVAAAFNLKPVATSDPEPLGVCRTTHGGSLRVGRAWRGKCYFPYQKAEVNVASAIDHLVLTKDYGVPMERKAKPNPADDSVFINPTVPAAAMGVRVCAAVHARDDMVDGKLRKVYLKSPGTMPPPGIFCSYSAKGAALSENDRNSISELILL
jgi:hypothetical protein